MRSKELKTEEDELAFVIRQRAWQRVLGKSIKRLEQQEKQEKISFLKEQQYQREKQEMK